MSDKATARLNPAFIRRVRDKVSELVSLLPLDEYDSNDFQKNILDRDLLIVIFGVQYLDDHGIESLKDEDEDTKAVEKTTKHMVNSLKWRKTMAIPRLTLSDFSLEFSTQEFFKIAVTGANNDKVTIVMDFGRHKRISTEANAMETAFFFVFTECVTLEHFNSGREVTVIFDHKNFSLSNMDSSFMLDFFSLMSTHYPTIVSKTLANDMPWYMKPVVSVARAVLPARITSSFSVVDGKSIFQFLDKEQVPVWMGGECDCQPIAMTGTKDLKEVTERYGVSESDVTRLKEYYRSCAKSLSSQ